MTPTDVASYTRPQPREPVPQTAPDEGTPDEPGPAPRGPGPGPSTEPMPEPKPVQDPDEGRDEQ